MPAEAAPPTIDEAFLAALFPGSHRVLGVRLRPYCLGHLAALMAIGAPLVAGDGARIGAGDLLAAVRVCRSPGWPVLSPYDLRPRWRDAVRRWWLERKPTRLRAAVQAFMDYQDAHCSFPKFYSQESTKEDDVDRGDVPTGNRLSAPFLLSRVCAVVMRTSVSQAEAWQMPLALPSWMIGTLDELEGSPVRFLDESEDNEDALPPDPEAMSEKEIAKLATQHLPPEAASAWLAARKAAKVKAPRKPRKKKGKRDVY